MIGRPPNFRNLGSMCAQMWGLAPAPAPHPHPPDPGRRRRGAEAAVAGRAGRGTLGARKSRVRTASWALTTRTMARPNLVLAIGLALLAFCLLALPEDTWAAPREHMTGGRQNLSPDDPQVQKAAQAAVAGYNMGNNSPYFFRDTKVIKAESQLVAGIKYYLTLDLGSTACRKSKLAGDNVNLTTCPFAAGAEEERLRCDFEILVVPWQNSTKLLKQDCVPL
ncbi:cystatin-M isoform X1 [Ochotona princeps]|uniref:cystatin-M isoform X1 n=1 Tax=Ochotona princeps TaxID=9978 RepID=UPI0027144CCE|nr:cystatin-M isoform X1 [Ochotona princeps]